MPDQLTFTKILCIAEPLGYVEIFFGDADRRACLSLTWDADGLRQMADLRDALNRFLVKQAPAPQSCVCPNGHGQMARDDGPLAPGASRAPSWKCATCGIERMWPDAVVVPAPAPQEEHKNYEPVGDELDARMQRYANHETLYRDAAVGRKVTGWAAEVSDIQRNLAVAEDALARLTWQPMDTAPKEQRVLVALKPYPLQHEGEITFGYLATSRDEPLGIWTLDETGEACLPTHWMPLPPAPDRSLPDPKS